MANDSLTDDIFGSTLSSDDEVIETGKIFDKEGAPPEKPIFKEDRKSPPNRHAARTSGEDVIGGAVVAIGTFLVNRRIDPGVGACLRLQSPITGKRVDAFIANTWLDKLLQPVFRKSEDFEGLGTVLGLPILIGLVERKPEMAPILWGTMAELMGDTLEEMGKLNKAKKAKRRRAFTRKDLADMLGVDENDTDDMGNYIIPKDVDPGEFMLRAFIFNQEPEMNGATEG